MQDELERFKAAESVDATVLIIDDPAAQRVIVAWQFCSVEILEMDADLKDLSEVDRWDALWKAVRFDRDKLAARSGLARVVADQRFEMVRAARLIYPDGTVNRLALQVIKAQAVEGLRKGRSKRK